MNEKDLAEIFKEAGIENEIKCPQAFAIAKKHKISKKAIGDYCNSHTIKIRACQLGCFR
jgi:hypothetical protein